MDRWQTFLVVAVLAITGTACGSEPAVRANKVGRAGRDFVDTARPNWITGGPRPLATTIWYPAQPMAEEVPWTVGGPPLLPAFRAGRDAVGAALLDGGPYPLVLMSHGTGGSAAQLAWLGEYLSSREYIVVAVNHHGNTATGSLGHRRVAERSIGDGRKRSGAA